MKKCRGAGRPRCFDTEQVLETASELFWKKGYSATSVSDLSQATGLNKGSLYSSFGDKHTLFLKCLKRYLASQIENIKERLQSEDPVQGLKQCFEHLASPPKPTKPCGCLAINSLTELAPHDVEIKELLDAHLQEVERLVSENIDRTEQPSALSSKQGARIFCSLAMATRARTRSGEPDRLDREMAKSALALIFPPQMT